MRSTLLFILALTFVLQACSTAPPASPSSPLYRITLEDAGEALLIAEALRVRPEMMEGKDFIYRATPAAHRALLNAGYAPVAVAGHVVIRPRYVRIAKRGDVAQVVAAGVTLVLDEREAWVVRGMPQQIAKLRELGYQISGLGKLRPRPRKISFEASPADLDALSGTVDIHEVRRIRGTFVVIGSAFDDEIAAVRARGITVTILEDVF